MSRSCPPEVLQRFFAKEREDEQVTVNCPGRGFVYFLHVETERVFKIGFTTLNPFARLSTLQTGSYATLRLVATVIGAPMLERMAHRALSSCHLHNEWFAGKGVVDDIVREVRSVDPLCADPTELTRRHALGMPFYVEEMTRARRVMLDMLSWELS